MGSLDRLRLHLSALQACDRCSKMHKPVVVGRPVLSRILLVGQAPGDKEPVMGRPFAWTAGRTLFKWFTESLGWTEDETRDRIYFAAVCRCFPGKKPAGGDRVPDDDEIAACSSWLDAEVRLLKPDLLIPVGKLAIERFLGESRMNDTIGRSFRVTCADHAMDCIPLPHPSGASPWHRMEPGISLLRQALGLIARHPAVVAAGEAKRRD
ncbi:uracil DNA glycosylase superfamily protein [mine drainage metagenome]|uniref:Uracil DNA glycosylase superfamily protein n=1 Tax=mine drainage metagenome TaxID=410659 RepID=A0A1J5SEU7_9ZZZZ